MIGVVCFWAGLALPGYAAARLLGLDRFGGGALSVIAVSYLLAFALLSPFSLFGYAIGLPIESFAATYLVAVLGSVGVIVRRRWWMELPRATWNTRALELVPICVFIWIGARIGGFLGGDAEIHVARIRFLVDHGLGNQDPFVAAPAFFRVYHTNLHHALIAACARITDGDPILAWRYAEVWSRLAIVSGWYFMGWSIYRKRAVAWGCAVAAAATWAAIDYTVYPNALAPGWLLPMGIGFAVRACRRSGGRRDIALLAITSAVLGQLHGMYAFFAGLLLAPGSAVLGGWDRWTKRRPAGWATGAVVALLAAAPFAAASRFPGAGRLLVGYASAAGSPPPPEVASFLPGSSLAPLSAMGWPDAHIMDLLVLVGLALTARRRPREAVVLAVALAVSILPVRFGIGRDALTHLTGADWSYRRLKPVVETLSLALIVGGWLTPLERVIDTRWRHGFLSLAIFAFAGTHRTGDFSAWEQMLERARASEKSRTAKFHWFDSIRGLLRDHVPPDSVILADPNVARFAVMVHDCRVLGARNVNSVSNDAASRNKDLARLLHPKTPLRRRWKLLRKYQIRYVFQATNARNAWAKKLGETYREGGFEVIALDPSLVRARLEAE